MKNLVLPLLMLLFSVNVLQAQEDSIYIQKQQAEVKQAPKITPYYGLIFGLSFGNYTRININPTIGFPLTPQLSLGARVGYEYVKDTRYALDQTWNNYGASVFARYKVIPRAYVHAEYAYYNYNYKTDVSEDSFWVPFLYVGGGYIQPVGNNVAVVLEVLFDVLQNEKSPYGDWDPIISIGVQAGF